MKRNRLVVAGLGLAAASLAIFSIYSFKSRQDSRYHPSGEVELGTNDPDMQGAHDAANWLYNIQKNQVTGLVDPQAVLDAATRARQSINAYRNSVNPQTASINWHELGPDNIGGRTRAILIDALDATHQHMWAGGVGGGLFESTDGANNWHRCAAFFNVPGVVITITTIAQGPDGALYVGTGEGDFYPAYSNGAGGLLGGGIYKSTDDGVTWASLSSTVPTANNAGTAWAAVNKIVVDPSNASTIYAGTNKGFKKSTDGGTTWASVSGPSVSISTTDVDIASNGTIIGTCGNKPWVSTDGGATFVNHGTTAFGWISATLSRAELAIAPSDPNIVYAFCAGSNAGGNPLAGMLISIDGGMNWTQVTGAGNAQFDPFGGNGQGDYDNIVTVDPSDSHHAIFGGVELWEYHILQTSPSVSGQWNRIALEFPASAFNPWYVHSDKHAIVFHPTNHNCFFIGTDGGVFRTLDAGATYQQMNKGYNVTQCYSVAPANDAGYNSMALAGCQDNGTVYIDGLGNDSMDASSVGGGDGGDVEISYLNPNAIFTTVYYAQLARSNNRGSSSSSPYADDRLNGTGMSGTAGFANFVTPIRLWESPNDLLSGDTVRVVNSTEVNGTTLTDGIAQTYSGQLTQNIVTCTPAASFVTTGATVICGPDTAVSTAGVFSGDATGTISSTGAYSITFNTVPAANRIVKIFYDVTFASGTIFTVNSNVAGRELYHTTPVTVNPGDTIKVQDVVQSRLALGCTGNHGVWITRRAIDFSVNPLFIKIGGMHSTPVAYSGEAAQLAWSNDGDKLYVATSNGNLFRFDNLGSVTDSANGDTDYGATAAANGVANPTCIVRCHLIGSFGGRYICGLDVDPADNGHVIVTLGNYQNTSYVYTSVAADTSTSNANSQWSDKTGNLDNIGGCPVYTVAFDKYAPNRVLAGTEHGVFETTNITAAAPSWTPAMNGLDNVAVFQIRQQRWDKWLVPNAGCFYIGTHGRGMWRDDSSWQGVSLTGIDNNGYNTSNTVINNNDLKIFPNPSIDHSYVNVDLPTNGPITVQIVDLNGRTVSSNVVDNVTKGINNVEFETGELAGGTYILVVTQDDRRIGTGRFFKMN
ncbi:MAG TPA: T9SS type A sorting domain-containing protein [Bacteroidia bacterium]|jgi:hypothetical protein|nr:T9SS type A sorting domain-containing protein [Bacteroidia bacterium]